MSIEDQKRRNALVNTSSAILCLEALAYRVEISPEAKKTLERRLGEFLNQPVRRIFEMNEPQASKDFSSGISVISRKACELAANAGRSTVSSSDIEEAIRINFCSVWPFCR